MCNDNCVNEGTKKNTIKYHNFFRMNSKCKRKYGKERDRKIERKEREQVKIKF